MAIMLFAIGVRIPPSFNFIATAGGSKGERMYKPVVLAGSLVVPLVAEGMVMRMTGWVDDGDKQRGLVA